MNRVIAIAAALSVVSLLIVAHPYRTVAQTQSADNSRPIARQEFGTLTAQVGSGAVAEKQDETGRDERAFIPVEFPSMGDSLLIDLAELVLSVSIVPETTISTAHIVRGGANLETSVATVYVTTTSPAISVFPATVSVNSRSGDWSTEWDEMTGDFDVEFATFAPVEFSESGYEARIDVTEIVRQWVAGSLPNHGFVVKAFEEDKSAIHWIRDARYHGRDAKVEILYSRNPLSAR